MFGYIVLDSDFSFVSSPVLTFSVAEGFTFDVITPAVPALFPVFFTAFCILGLFRNFIAVYFTGRIPLTIIFIY